MNQVEKPSCYLSRVNDGAHAVIRAKSNPECFPSTPHTPHLPRIEQTSLIPLPGYLDQCSKRV